MVKFNMALANHILDQKLERYLSLRSSYQSHSKLKVNAGVLTYVKTPIAMIDTDRAKTVLVFEIPEQGPSYAKIVRQRLIKKAQEINWSIDYSKIKS